MLALFKVRSVDQAIWFRLKYLSNTWMKFYRDIYCPRRNKPRWLRRGHHCQLHDFCVAPSSGRNIKLFSNTLVYDLFTKCHFHLSQLYFGVSESTCCNTKTGKMENITSSNHKHVAVSLLARYHEDISICLKAPPCQRRGFTVMLARLSNLNLLSKLCEWTHQTQYTMVNRKPTLIFFYSRNSRSPLSVLGVPR